MPRKSKKPVKKQNALAYGQGSWPSRSDTATDDSWDRGHEGGSDGMGVYEQGLTALHLLLREGRRGGRGAQGQAREGANS